MKKLRSRLVSVGLLAGIVVAAYKLLLTPEARESLKRAGKTIKESYDTITRAYGDAQGETMQEDVLPNRVATEAQWEAIGF